jgi:ubiquitin-conjugating enzyme E2 J2
MSYSDFHPESWSPLWGVSTILVGLQSFMMSSEITTGGMLTSDAEKRKLALQTTAFY